MGLKSNNNFTKCNFFCKITEDEKKEPRFTMYKYVEESKVDFNNPIGNAHNISGKLVELYEKEKEDKDTGAKYMLYGFIFEDSDGKFNITISKKNMESWINRLVNCKTFNIEISVFDAPSTKGDKIYRNFGIWEDGQILPKRMEKEEIYSKVVETPNAAGNLTKDYSVLEKTYIDMFEELKQRLVEKDAENVSEILDDVLEKKETQDDLPF